MTKGILWTHASSGCHFVSYGTDSEVATTAASICRFASEKGVRVDIQPFLEKVGMFSYLLIAGDGTPIKVWR